MIKRKPLSIFLLLFAFLAGCAAIGTLQMERRFGNAEPRERVVSDLPATAIDYWTEVKPIVEQRCVVCHACYDAPCQMKMSAIEGIARGATSAKVYQATRLDAAPLTRLFEDAHTVSEWRKMGFHPVLNEFGDTLEANREASVLYRILKLKELNPLPDARLLPEAFDLSLDRNEFCAQPETFDRFVNEHPLWGMPYALPGLTQGEQSALLTWIEQGARYTPRPELEQPFVDEISLWETFLNGDSLKAQLMSRYLYEHLFLAHLYIPQLDKRRFFRMVRSSTPPGEPVDLIATRRPYNDPGVDRVWYRLVEEHEAIVAKTHMPYALDAQRLERWKSLFIEADYEVTALPSYAEKDASNPFRTFDEIPVGSRYRFMLDEAQFTVMSFIKGPVCRGQVALNVINDHFWVFFIDPDDVKLDIVEEFLAKYDEYLTLPASTKNIYRPIAHWRKYAQQQKELLAALDAFLTEHYREPKDISLDLVWDGDGSNDNAALTVFRHFDSATVTKGLVGQYPKTAWLIGYSLLERIHYLLVAGYDVYGNIGHQLLSRVDMDFLRMEGETAFLLMLPPEARERERKFWYRGAAKEVQDFMTLPRFESEMVPAIAYQTNDEKTELYGLLAERLQPVLAKKYVFESIRQPVREALRALNGLVGGAVSQMPQVAFLEIAGPSGSDYVTLVRNNAHLNITSIFGEQQFREPDEDTLTIAVGLLGAYPNAFFRVEESDLEQFTNQIAGLTTEADYTLLVDEFGIRRTDPMFWRQSDTFQSAYREMSSIEFGLFDYNRLENR